MDLQVDGLSEHGRMMAETMMGLKPVPIIVFVGQRHSTRGMVITGVKG